MATRTTARPATDGLADQAKADAERVDTGSALAGYPTAFLVCQADRHRWSRRYVWSLVSAAMARRTTICEDCGTKRSQLVNTRGWYRTGAYTYEHPDGYLMRGAGLTRGDYQAENLRRGFEAAQATGRLGEDEL